MGLSVKTGSFVTETATGSKAYTGLGFQPKVLLLWSVGGVTAGTFRTGAYTSVGFGTDSTHRAALGWSSQNGQNFSNCARTQGPNVLDLVQWDVTTHIRADLVSMDSDGFTLNYTTVNATAKIVHYLAIGGSDITSCTVLDWPCGVATGNKVVTGVGFQPDAVMHLSIGEPSSGSSLQADARLSFGMMEAGGGQWSNVIYSVDNSGTSDSQRHQQTGKCIQKLTTTPSVNMAAQFVSMDSDGFTVNFTSVTGVAERVFSLCLKGGSHSLGSFSAITSGGPAQDSPSLGLAPLTYLLSSFNSSGQASPIGSTRWSLGGSDGTSEETAWANDTDALGTSASDTLSKTDKAIVICSATPAVLGEADHSALGSDVFTLTWSTVPVTAHELLYWAIGAGAAPAARIPRWLPVMRTHDPRPLDAVA